MAKVILSENSNALFAQPDYFTNSTIAFVSAGQPHLLSGFFQNLIDGLGDFGTGLINIGVGATGAVTNIVQGARKGVGSYLQNPDNIAQVGSGVATALTGMPISLPSSGGQQQQQYYNQPQPDVLGQLTQNPLLLIGGAAILYFALKK